MIKIDAFRLFSEKLAILGPFFPDFPISQISREFPGLAKLELGFPGLKKRGKLQTLSPSTHFSQLQSVRRHMPEKREILTKVFPWDIESRLG